MKSWSTVTRGIAQRGLPFRVGRGGARKGAGRKPKGEVAGLRHEKRAVVARHQPLHVTVKLVRGLPNLRCQEVRHVLRYVFGNAHKHFEQGKGPKVDDPIDLFSSAPWFDGSWSR